MTDQLHEVYAVHFAHHAARRRVENFLGGDPHDGPMPFDYYVFAISGPAGVWLLDSGFDAAVARKRGRQHLRCPTEGLRLVGIEPADVDHVVLSHLHYDHCGNQDLFPNAVFHLQQAEMAYATGPCMRHQMLRVGYDPDDLAATLRQLFRDRLVFHDGDAAVGPGLSLHRIGGHTDGQQAMRVATRRGHVVLASDAVHFFENFERNLPFPWLYHVGAALDGFERLRGLASEPGLVIPGHDGAILRRFPAAGPGCDGVVVRID